MGPKIKSTTPFQIETVPIALSEVSTSVSLLEIVVRDRNHYITRALTFLSTSWPGLPAACSPMALSPLSRTSVKWGGHESQEVLKATNQMNQRV